MELLIVLAVVAYLGTHYYWKSKDPIYWKHSFPKQISQAVLALVVAILAIANQDKLFAVFWIFLFLFELFMSTKVKPAEEPKTETTIPPGSEN
jgi:hypothetical protein